MSKKSKNKIIQTNLYEHPAVKAWRVLKEQCDDPERIEIIKQQKHSSVYRLSEAGPGNSAVIAKRSWKFLATVERTIYEEVLPRLSLTTPHYYGFVEEEETSADHQFCWLFLEDIGSLRFSAFVPEHRTELAQWLGVLHAGAANVGANVKARLPDRGPAHYIRYLRSIGEAHPKISGNPALKADDLMVLKNIVSMCEFLESHWSQIEIFCNRMPRTVIHGDCLPKNVHVRTIKSRLTVVPFDWTYAGWGLPAADLGQSALPFHGRTPDDPDLTSYLFVVRDQWSHLDVQTIRRLGNLGKIFWCLAVIGMELPTLEFEWADVEKARLYSRYLEKEMINLKIYETVLADSIRSLEWVY